MLRTCPIQAFLSAAPLQAPTTPPGTLGHGRHAHECWDYREADFRKTTQQLQHTTFFKLRSLYTLVFGKIVADPRAMWDGVKACRSLHSRLRPRRGASLGALLPVSPFTRNRIPPLRETGSDKQTNTPRRALFTEERSRTWFPKDLSLQSGAGNRRRTLIGTVKGLACRCSRLQGEVLKLNASVSTTRTE